MRPLNLTGRKFNNFTVLSEVPNDSGRTRWLCQCTCGRTWVTSSDLVMRAKGCPKCARKDSGKRMFSIPNCGKRLLDVINEKNIKLQALTDATGIAKGTIYAFLYNGRDMSSMRLARVCAYCGVSIDYVMGLVYNKERLDGGNGG